jgi:hypothetical protein
MKFYAVELNEEGVVWGFLQVQSNLTLSESGNEYTSPARWDLLDANWKVVFSGTSECKATRLETPGQD